MDRSMWKIAFFVSLFSSMSALAEAGPSKKLLKPVRRVASLETSSSPAYREVRAGGKIKTSSPLQFRLGLTGGYGMSNGSELGTASESGEVADRALTFAFNADLTLYHYFGLELEGAMGLNSSQSTEVSAETPFSQQRARSVSSAMANLKGQIPFRAGAMKIVPRLGVGFAFAQIKEQVTFSGFEDAPSSETQARLNVPYVTLGVDFQPISRWTLSFDFAKSMGGSGKLAFGNSDTDQSLQNVDLMRLRASVSYRLSPVWSVGGQFVRRSSAFSQPLGDGDSFPSSIIQNQFLGLVQLDL
jgi:hypothetical protein